MYMQHILVILLLLFFFLTLVTLSGKRRPCSFPYQAEPRPKASLRGSLVDPGWKCEFELPDGPILSHTSTERVTNILTAKHQQVLRCKEENNLY